MLLHISVEQLLLDLILLMDHKVQNEEKDFEQTTLEIDKVEGAQLDHMKIDLDGIVDNQFDFKV